MAKSPWLKCIVTKENIISGQVAHARSLRETELTSESFRKTPENSTSNTFYENVMVQKERSDSGEDLLKDHLLSSWPSFQEKSLASRKVNRVSNYSLCCWVVTSDKTVDMDGRTECARRATCPERSESSRCSAGEQFGGLHCTFTVSSTVSIVDIVIGQWRGRGTVLCSCYSEKKRCWLMAQYYQYGFRLS